MYQYQKGFFGRDWAKKEATNSNLNQGILLINVLLSLMEKLVSLICF